MDRRHASTSSTRVTHLCRYTSFSVIKRHEQPAFPSVARHFHDVRPVYFNYMAEKEY